MSKNGNQSDLRDFTLCIMLVLCLLIWGGLILLQGGYDFPAGACFMLVVWIATNAARTFRRIYNRNVEKWTRRALADERKRLLDEIQDNDVARVAYYSGTPRLTKQ